MNSTSKEQLSFSDGVVTHLTAFSLSLTTVVLQFFVFKRVFLAEPLSTLFSYSQLISAFFSFPENYLNHAGNCNFPSFVDQMRTEVLLFVVSLFLLFFCFAFFVHTSIFLNVLILAVSTIVQFLFPHHF